MTDLQIAATVAGEVLTLVSTCRAPSCHHRDATRVADQVMKPTPAIAASQKVRKSGNYRAKSSEGRAKSSTLKGPLAQPRCPLRLAGGSSGIIINIIKLRAQRAQLPEDSQKTQ